ncbi:MAG: hypothetical protein ACRDK3_14930 [Actinomycetota bacterium]
MRAYVLVQTAGNKDLVARDLRAISGVRFAEDLRGPYDVIAMIGSGQRPLDAVLAEIRGLTDVTRAVSAPLVDSLSDTEAA